MEYTILKLSKLAGISTRTLRYYDEIDLLKPKRINSSGYRIYGQKEVDTLQQILFYRELGVELAAIDEILNAPEYDRVKALYEHERKLEEKQKQLEMLIQNVRRTICREKGEIRMSDKEKFEGFKKQLVEENEEKYGSEIREKYGDETVDDSNARMMNMGKETYDQMQKLGGDILEALEAAVRTGENPAGEAGQKIAGMHKEWLGYTWKQYSPQAHAGLAQMYVDDERFTAYYDRKETGCAEFLNEAVRAFVK